MIWAIVSSQSCFCWQYRASPSLATKSIINLISVLTIWWCPCVESSLVLLGEGLCYDQCVLLAKLYQSLLCFIPYSKAKFACYSRCFLTSYFCIPVPYNEKDIFFFLGVSSKSSYRSSYNRSTSASSALQVGDRVGLLWYWIVCLGNEQRCFCRFWDCIQVLHFGLLLTMMATPFLLRDSCPRW